jgi:polyhydroxyalkanoate synthesis regulator phasin
MLGIVALTPEEIRKIVDGLVSQGSLTPEQGELLASDLLDRTKKESSSAGKRLEKEFQRLAELVPVRRGELRRLEERVQALEEKIGLPQEAPDEVSPGEEGAAGSDR